MSSRRSPAGLGSRTARMRWSNSSRTRSSTGRCWASTWSPPPGGARLEGRKPALRWTRPLGLPDPRIGAKHSPGEPERRIGDEQLELEAGELAGYRSALEGPHRTGFDIAHRSVLGRLEGERLPIDLAAECIRRPHDLAAGNGRPAEAGGRPIG